VSRTLRRFAVPLAIVLLFLLLPNPPALAAPGGSAFRFTDWLEALTRLWADSGCILDPGGRCSATPIWAPEGCIIDPHGGCRDSALPQRTERCGIDPHGNCAR
jgi:hypothetical protein